MIPEIGKTYEGFGYGQGIVVVLEIDGRGDNWRRVYVEYTAGCCLGPPSDRPDAPEEEWDLPRERVWIDRKEWDEISRMRRAERGE